MADFTAKIRRYLLYPMLRPKSKEFFLVLACAAFLALIYVYTFADRTNIDDGSLEEEVIRPATQVVLTSDPTPSNDTSKVVAGVLVICSSRAAAITNHLKQLLTLRPSSAEFPIIVSQDGNNDEVKNRVIKIPRNEGITFYRHERRSNVRSKTYEYIAAHYKFALDKAFNAHHFDHVIVTEDDLDISPDFFSYFAWARRALDADTSLWCASAWNDHGIPRLIDPKANSRMWRTDFFPGLGWMLSKELWRELSGQWPSTYWDDWMRTPAVRKNRSCIRPEISRTAHNMVMAGKGSSGGLYKNFLSSINFNKDPVDFSLIPIDGILKSTFEKELSQSLADSREIPFDDFFTYKFDPQYSYRVSFSGIRNWRRLSKHIGLMLDIRSGMLRTVYHGLVTVFHQSCRLFIVPEGYNMTDVSTYSYNREWDKMNRYLDFATVYCKPTKFTGTCDPYSNEMKEWFKRKGQSKKLASWGEMIVV